jgi:hypothetical protein
LKHSLSVVKVFEKDGGLIEQRLRLILIRTSCGSTAIQRTLMLYRPSVAYNTSQQNGFSVPAVDVVWSEIVEALVIPSSGVALDYPTRVEWSC